MTRLITAIRHTHRAYARAAGDILFPVRQRLIATAKTVRRGAVMTN